MSDLCKWCGRDTPTTICFDGEGNAVPACIDCQEKFSAVGYCNVLSTGVY
jgi:hypothetical protein